MELPTDNPLLSLRELELPDAPTYFALIERDREHLMQHGDYQDEGNANIDWVRQSLQAPSNGLRFALWYDGSLVGRADLIPKVKHRHVLGYWISMSHEGRGLMASALRSLMEYGRTTFGVTEYFAGVTHGNARSVALLERLGFAVQDAHEHHTTFHKSL